jgi:hypothetical protein
MGVNIIYEPANGQEVNTKPQLDNLEPERIPVVINGCVLETKDSSTIPIKKEVSLNKNILNDLYFNVLEARSIIPTDMKHKVLIIGGSHLRDEPMFQRKTAFFKGKIHFFLLLNNFPTARLFPKIDHLC